MITDAAWAFINERELINRVWARAVQITPRKIRFRRSENPGKRA